MVVVWPSSLLAGRTSRFGSLRGPLSAWSPRPLIGNLGQRGGRVRLRWVRAIEPGRCAAVARVEADAQHVADPYPLVRRPRRSHCSCRTRGYDADGRTTSYSGRPFAQDSWCCPTTRESSSPPPGRCSRRCLLRRRRCGRSGRRGGRARACGRQWRVRRHSRRLRTCGALLPLGFLRSARCSVLRLPPRGCRPLP